MCKINDCNNENVKDDLCKIHCYFGTTECQKGQKIVEYAFLREYEKVEIYMSLIDDKWLDISNNVARIAIIYKDIKLMQIIDHNPRMMLKEFAHDFLSLKFLVDHYINTDWKDGNGVPRYVWESACLESAKYLAEWDGVPGMEMLDDSSEDIKEHFGWIAPCDECRERGEDCNCSENFKVYHNFLKKVEKYRELYPDNSE